MRILFEDIWRFEEVSGEVVDRFIFHLNDNWSEIPIYQEGYEFTKRLILEMRKMCLNQGTDFLLVLFPTPPQVGPNEWAKGRKYFGFEENKEYNDNFQKIMISFAEEERMDVFDMLPFYRNYVKAHPDSALHFSFDGHLTITGNKVVAEAVRQYLENNYFPAYLSSIHIRED